MALLKVLEVAVTFFYKSIKHKKPQQMLGFCDLDWIQTSNLLSRNQVRYSVAPRGLFAKRLIVLLAGANIGIKV